MENTLNTLTKSQTDNFIDLTDLNGKLTIKTSYERNKEIDDIGNILELNKVATDEVEILSERKVKNGVQGIECELLINHSKDAFFELDINGHLKVVDYNVDKYEINDMGELILKL